MKKYGEHKCFLLKNLRKEVNKMKVKEKLVAMLVLVLLNLGLSEWTAIESFLIGRAWIEKIMPLNEKIVFVRTGDARVFKTIDGGEHWEEVIIRNDAGDSIMGYIEEILPVSEKVAFCIKEENNFSSFYKFYKTTNFGNDTELEEDWILIPDSFPEIDEIEGRFVLRAVDENLAYFLIPFGCFKYEGERWEEINNGLPLDLLRKGDFELKVIGRNLLLLFLSYEEGGKTYFKCFRSINQGSSWEESSNGLPSVIAKPLENHEGIHCSSNGRIILLPLGEWKTYCRYEYSSDDNCWFGMDGKDGLFEADYCSYYTSRLLFDQDYYGRYFYHHKRNGIGIINGERREEGWPTIMKNFCRDVKIIGETVYLGTKAGLFKTKFSNSSWRKVGDIKGQWKEIYNFSVLNGETICISFDDNLTYRSLYLRPNQRSSWQKIWGVGDDECMDCSGDIPKSINQIRIISPTEIFITCTGVYGGLFWSNAQGKILGRCGDGEVQMLNGKFHRGVYYYDGEGLYKVYSNGTENLVLRNQVNPDRWTANWVVKEGLIFFAEGDKLFKIINDERVEEITRFDGQEIKMIKGIGEEIIYVLVEPRDRLLKSVDGGRSWSEIENFVFSDKVNHIEITESQELVYVSRENVNYGVERDVIYFSANDGQNWRKIGEFSLIRKLLVSGNTLFVSGYRGLFGYSLEGLRVSGGKKASLDSSSFSYPNPLNSECYIPLNAKCKIYNILGQLVREIKISNFSSQISQSIYWNARDSAGLKIPTGVYFYEVAREGIIRKMVVLR
jgi:hypothetical protein